MLRFNAYFTAFYLNLLANASKMRFFCFGANVASFLFRLANNSENACIYFYLPASVLAKSLFNNDKATYEFEVFAKVSIT